MLALMMTDQVDFAVFDIGRCATCRHYRLNRWACFAAATSVARPPGAKDRARTGRCSPLSVRHAGHASPSISLIDGLDAAFTQDATGGNSSPIDCRIDVPGRFATSLPKRTPSVSDTSARSRTPSPPAASPFSIWPGETSPGGRARYRPTSADAPAAAARSFIAIIRKRMRTIADS